LDNLDEAVQRVLGGDAAAFQQIVEATSHRLVRLSARIVGNLADAEDVVQEAYVKAYRSLSGGQFDRRSRVETWLYRIVVNGSIDAKRARARAAVPSDTLDDIGWDGAASAEARLALAELSDMLSDLPPDQKAALVLKSVEGFSSSEIGEIMGRAEGAVEQLLVRGRAALKKKKEEAS
jgi:RNA polymerase sigma-70 factor (ECF subfamily)